MISLEMMPPLMFVGLIFFMLIGYPVAFTLSARNIKTWTKWSSVDPESFWTVEQFARTAQAQVPPLQQVLLSMNVTF